jgi:hypothetical protein
MDQTHSPFGSSADFFAGLPPLPDPRHTFDDGAYRAAPDDWAQVVTDIVGSTRAIAAGQHKTVNFVAAMAIAAARNLCAPEPIPFLFGGDGAVLMVPPTLLAGTHRSMIPVEPPSAQRSLELGFGASYRAARYLRPRFAAVAGRLRPMVASSNRSNARPPPGMIVEWAVGQK